MPWVARHINFGTLVLTSYWSPEIGEQTRGCGRRALPLLAPAAMHTPERCGAGRRAHPARVRSRRASAWLSPCKLTFTVKIQAYPPVHTSRRRFSLSSSPKVRLPPISPLPQGISAKSALCDGWPHHCSFCARSSLVAKRRPWKFEARTLAIAPRFVESVLLCAMNSWRAGFVRDAVLPECIMQRQRHRRNRL